MPEGVAARTLTGRAGISAVGIWLVEAQSAAADPGTISGEQIYGFFLEKGCLIRPLGNVLYLNPPYCISEEELDKLHVVLLDFLDSI